MRLASRAKKPLHPAFHLLSNQFQRGAGVQRTLHALKRRISAALSRRVARSDLGHESRALSRSDLPESIRASAARSLLKLDWRARAKLPNPIDLIGYSVSYFQEEDLRYLFREILVEGDYLFRPETERPLIFDCGSNIGLSILFFKRLYPKARIIAFEPDPATFSMLKRNIETNRLDEVALNNFALSSEDGELTFHRSAEKSGSLMMSTSIERLRGDSTQVSAKRLSPLITSQVDLLKMDIEGAEHAVLPELAATGKLSLIKQMHIEYHHHIVANEDRLSGILKLLEDAGFGYQIRTPSRHWPVPNSFHFSRWPTPYASQDLSIYCYQKNDRFRAEPA
jgi:FkbM family methyltransferase